MFRIIVSDRKVNRGLHKLLLAEGFAHSTANRNWRKDVLVLEHALIDTIKRYKGVVRWYGLDEQGRIIPETRKLPSRQARGLWLKALKP